MSDEPDAMAANIELRNALENLIEACDQREFDDYKIERAVEHAKSLIDKIYNWCR